jgi:hypothetical protein
MTVVSNFGLWNSGTYIPFTCDISSIAKGATTTITTSTDHGFVVGNSVQFVIPKEYGMRQLNKRVGYVLSITSDTLEVNIDSANFDAFVIPTPVSVIIVLDPAQVLPVGDNNTGYQTPGNSTPTLKIPGTYRNTYP